MVMKKIYLKRLMSLLLVALAVPQVMADELTISKGDVSNKSEVPFWTSYGDYGYHGQMIYSQDDLADLPSGATITAITFSATSNIVATGGSVNTPFVIKMGEPTNATYSLASFVTDNLTTVTTTADIWSGTTDVTINFTTHILTMEVICLWICCVLLIHKANITHHLYIGKHMLAQIQVAMLEVILQAFFKVQTEQVICL